MIAPLIGLLLCADGEAVILQSSGAPPSALLAMASSDSFVAPVSAGAPMKGTWKAAQLQALATMLLKERPELDKARVLVSADGVGRKAQITLAATTTELAARTFVNVINGTLVVPPDGPLLTVHARTVPADRVVEAIAKVAQYPVKHSGGVTDLSAVAAGKEKGDKRFSLRLAGATPTEALWLALDGKLGANDCGATRPLRLVARNLNAAEAAHVIRVTGDVKGSGKCAIEDAKSAAQLEGGTLVATRTGDTEPEAIVRTRDGKSLRVTKALPAKIGLEQVMAEKLTLQLPPEPLPKDYKLVATLVDSGKGVAALFSGPKDGELFVKLDGETIGDDKVVVADGKVTVGAKTLEL
jgi:hypothetical protein